MKYLFPLSFITKRPLTLVAALLLADLVFVALYCFRVLGTFGDLLADPKFSIVTENGYAEYFQYIKFFCIVVALSVIWIYSKEKIYMGWLLLFAYLFLDDSIGIHEWLGLYLADAINIPSVFGIRPIDFGEILVSAFFGILFLSVIGYHYRKSGTLAKQVSVILLVLLGLLAFCGIVMDVVHSMTDHFFGNTWIQHIPLLLEDGGEHVTVSCMLGFTYAVALHYSREISRNPVNIRIEKAPPVI